jgi:hypothetical protein
VFIVIPKKMIKSIDRISCMPANNQLHEMSDNDISIYCEFESEGERVENIKKWVEPGSFSLAWEIPTTLKLSKKIVLGHLDAYPPSIGTLLVSLIILVYLLFGIPHVVRFAFDINILQYVILIMIYLFVSAINYSFHNMRQSQISRGLYEVGGAALICILISFGLHGFIPWGLLEEIHPISWILILSLSSFIFVFISYRKEKDFYLPQNIRLSSINIIIFHCLLIFTISVLFSYSIGYIENYLVVWTLNNIYAIIGIKGLHKLIE